MNFWNTCYLHLSADGSPTALQPFTQPEKINAVQPSTDLKSGLSGASAIQTAPEKVQYSVWLWTE